MGPEIFLMGLEIFLLGHRPRSGKPLRFPPSRSQRSRLHRWCGTDPEPDREVGVDQRIREPSRTSCPIASCGSATMGSSPIASRSQPWPSVVVCCRVGRRSWSPAAGRSASGGSPASTRPSAAPAASPRCVLFRNWLPFRGTRGPRRSHDDLWLFLCLFLLPPEIGSRVACRDVAIRVSVSASSER